MMGKWYAVQRGWRPGVYRTWPECQMQVNKFSGAVHKSFPTYEMALDFVNGPLPDWAQPQPSQSRRRFQDQLYANQLAEMHSGTTYDQSESVEWRSVFTDGCCEKNGRRGARAGIGVFWGDGDPRNTALPLEGRPTNNRAEIHAARHAITQAKGEGISYLQVRTDSEFLIRSVTEWMPKWKRNGWTLVNGGEVKNREDFQALDTDMHGINIDWQHVPGHAGIYGNEQADRLARMGAAGNQF